MRLVPTLIAASMLSLVAVSAEARPFDPKALARYDHSYVECEAKNADMKGHRDEAWLSLWRIAADERSLERLKKARADAVYKAESQRIVRPAARGASAAPAATVQRQCQGLWAEFQRTKQPRRP